MQRWRDEAATTEGFLKVTWLEKALDLARRYGLAEAANELRVELGQLSPDDLDLEGISSQVSIPSGDVDAFIASTVGDDDAGSALTRLGLQPPPGGDRDALREWTQQLMSEHPLQYVFTNVLLGPDSSTAIFRADTEEKTLRLAMGRQHQQYAGLWGFFAADALEAIGERYGPLTPEEMTAFFGTDLIDQEIAERLARAVALFWSGEYDDAAHVVLPRIEAVVRNLARTLGVPIVHEPGFKKQVGGVSTLGVLLSDLDGAFADDAWRAYLQDLLVEPLSLNLRNHLLHGLTARATRTDAALLLHVACWLRLLRVGSRSNESDSATGNDGDNDVGDSAEIADDNNAQNPAS